MYQRYQIYTGYTKHRLRSMAYDSIFFLFLQVDKMIEPIAPIMVHWSTPRKAVDQDELARPWPRHGNPQTHLLYIIVVLFLKRSEMAMVCVCVLSVIWTLKICFQDSVHWILHSCALYVLWILCLPYLGIGGVSRLSILIWWKHMSSVQFTLVACLI